MRSALALLLVASVFAAVPSPGIAAETYHVSTQGSDANPGTQAQPWRTIQHAVNTVSAGTIVVADGTYDERPTILTVATAANPLIIRAANQQQVSCNGFSFSNARYVTIDGFAIQSLDANEQKGSGVYFGGSTADCTLLNCYIHHCAWYGVNTGGSTTNLTIRHNRVYRAYMAGLIVFGSGHLVEGNEIWGTINNSPTVGQTPGYDQDGIRFFGANLTFRANYIHDIRMSEAKGPNMPHIDAFQTWNNPSSTNCVLEDNVVDLPEHYNAYAYSKFANLEHCSGIIVRNNVCRAVGFIYANGMDTSDILGNTFVQGADAADWRPGIQITDGDNNEMLNNIFHGNLNGGAPAVYIGGSSTGNTYDYNCIYDDDGTPPGTRQPNDVWDLDPQIGSFPDVRLASTSPVIDAGLGHANLTDDKASVTRANPPDIGAYQHSGGAATATPGAPGAPTPTPTPTEFKTATPGAPGAPTPTPTPTKFKTRPPKVNRHAVWLSLQSLFPADSSGTVVEGTGAYASILMDTGDTAVHSLDLTIAFPENTEGPSVRAGALAAGFEIAEDRSTPGRLRVSLRRTEPITGSGELLCLTSSSWQALPSPGDLQIAEAAVNDGSVETVLDPGHLGGRVFLPVLRRDQ